MVEVMRDGKWTIDSSTISPKNCAPSVFKIARLPTRQHRGISIVGGNSGGSHLLCTVSFS